jgi:hypothetical protein
MVAAVFQSKYPVNEENHKRNVFNIPYNKPLGVQAQNRLQAELPMNAVSTRNTLDTLMPKQSYSYYKFIDENGLSLLYPPA